MRTYQSFRCATMAIIHNWRLHWGRKGSIALLGIAGALSLSNTTVLGALVDCLARPTQFQHFQQFERSPKLRAASPAPPKSNKTIWKPALVTPWHWMIDHPLDINDPLDMGLQDPKGKRLSFPAPVVYDIDWEMNSAKTVKALHAMNKKVICYVDVGAYESYRADAGKFPKAVRGKPDSHWEGSYWLDIRQLDVLLPIMRARFQVCKDKGFDAIEPDEVDGYANDTGFKLSYNDQLRYNRAIADLAHSMGMSVGLKGDIEQARDLWHHFDWTLNEQCFEFDECGALTKYFLANGKAVFHVEYDDPFSGHRVKTSEFCPQANAANFNSMKVPLDLKGGRWPCR